MTSPDGEMVTVIWDASSTNIAASRNSWENEGAEVWVSGFEPQCGADVE